MKIVALLTLLAWTATVVDVKRRGTTGGITATTLFFGSIALAVSTLL